MSTKGTCPECKRRFALRSDGKIRAHRGCAGNQQPLDTVVNDVVNGKDPNERILDARHADIWERVVGDEKVLLPVISDHRGGGKELFVVVSTETVLAMHRPWKVLEDLPEGGTLRLVWRNNAV